MLDFLNFRLLIGLQIAASIGGQQAGHANALQLSSSAQAPQSASSCGLQCLNGGSCRQAVNSLAFYCDCTGTGYSGALCSQMISPEAPSLAALATAGKCKAPCQNGGTCTQAVNSLAYYCVCSGTGYSGANCSIPIVAQQTSDTGCNPPCQHSGRCTQAVNSQAKYCDCTGTRYTGSSCSMPQATAAASPRASPMQAAPVAAPLAAPLAPLLSSQGGALGGGVACELSCQNGGACRQAINSQALYCDCSATGFTGPACSHPQDQASLQNGTSSSRNGSASSASSDHMASIGKPRAALQGWALALSALAAVAAVVLLGAATAGVLWRRKHQRESKFRRFEDGTAGVEIGQRGM